MTLSSGLSPQAAAGPDQPPEVAAISRRDHLSGAARTADHVRINHVARSRGGQQETDDRGVGGGERHEIRGDVLPLSGSRKPFSMALSRDL